ncbi:MAG: hypothetical protein CL814_05170 [Confluentimicrobium sp.]|nr:hypothetical protein [Actibacterium sp.]
MVSAVTRGATRQGAVFVAAITTYFALQTVLRLWLGGALETDEAEMMVMTPGLRWGYGPQLPLYNWLQWVLFELFGRDLFALSLLKNLLLWATYLFVFIGLRLFVPAGVAAAGALSLYLIPDVAWEAQRATTHSNMLLFTSAITLAAFLWVLKTGRWAAYGALGLAIGLGGLAKYNYWLVPIGLIAAALTLPAFRARVLSPRLLLSLGIAGLVLAGPYGWMLRNPGLAFSSSGKLAMGTAPGLAEQALDGLGQLLAGAAILSVLAVIVGAIVWAVGRGRRAGDPPPPVAALLLRAGAVVLVLMAMGVVAAGVGRITPRWLLPLVFLAVPGGAVWLGARMRPRGGVAFAAILAVLALAVLTGLGFDRYKDRARRAVDFTPLPEVLAGVAPQPGTPVVAEFYAAGNLARLRPDWRIAPYLPFAMREFGGGPVLFVLRENTPETLEQGLREAGWDDPGDPQILEQGAFTLTFTTSGEAMKMRYYLVDTPGPGGDD